MLRCALLLSLMTIRSVVGQPGVFPFSPGATKGSAGVAICTPRHRCVEVVGPRVQGAVAIFVRSAAAKATVVVATEAYGLPVPNSATRNSTFTVSAAPGIARHPRKGEVTGVVLRVRCGWSATKVGAALLRWFQTSLVA
jgi:hypothetical protein